MTVQRETRLQEPFAKAVEPSVRDGLHLHDRLRNSFCASITPRNQYSFRSCWFETSHSMALSKRDMQHLIEGRVVSHLNSLGQSPPAICVNWRGHLVACCPRQSETSQRAEVEPLARIR